MRSMQPKAGEEPGTKATDSEGFTEGAVYPCDQLGVLGVVTVTLPVQSLEGNV